MLHYNNLPFKYHLFGILKWIVPENLSYFLAIVEKYFTNTIYQSNIISSGSENGLFQKTYHIL
jgi:hypothetical protein